MEGAGQPGAEYRGGSLPRYAGGEAGRTGDQLPPTLAKPNHGDSV